MVHVMGNDQRGPMPARGSRALVWFRRDLRCEDHAALSYALQHYAQVYCAFVLDTDILQALPQRADRRVAFIHASVLQLHAQLQQLAKDSGAASGGLIVRHGRAQEVIVQLAQALEVQAVVANRDYEPAARARDAAVAQALQAQGRSWQDCKDHVLQDRSEVLTQQGRPYSKFTPYWRAWLQRLAPHLSPHPVAPWAHRLAYSVQASAIPSLAEVGFAESAHLAMPVPVGMQGAQQTWQAFLPRMAQYHMLRDFPAVPGTSQLSVHLRFGTMSIRQVAGEAYARMQQGDEGAQTWLQELAWRDFYAMILWHQPQVVAQAFRPAYDRVIWDDDDDLWQAWRGARTGYPLIDAAMRQLHQTGYMHNRLRMVVASFLTKDLGIDWRKGEAHFAQYLNDFDLASNNGGWQWAASTGCDAQPWFRIFNPVTQSQRFDPQGDFIRHYLPELAAVPTRWIHFPAAMPAREVAACGLVLGRDYPDPVVDHARARERTLMRFHFLGREEDAGTPR